MVRTYKRKTDEPRYSEEDLKNGTLSSHVLKVLNANIGHPTALACEEIRYLVDLTVTLQDWGQLNTYNDVLKYAQEYIEIMNLQSRFAGGAPTRDCSSLENVRAQGATSNIIDGWFKHFQYGESGFCEEASRRVVVIKCGTKYANQIQNSCGKGFTTVFLTISANGVRLPPYIIYKSLRLDSQWCPKNLIKGTVYNAFAKAGTFPYDPRAIKNDRIIKNRLSTIVGTPEQYAHILSNKLHTSSCLNVQAMVSRNTLVRSNSAPNLFIDHSISTTTSQLELNPTGSGDDIENDATEKKSPIITPIASPNGHIHSSSLNFSFNSTSSSVASIDAGSTKPLSAIEAIVAKYLTPKQSTTSKPVKRLIKRPYCVSVTDLDVLGENIMKQRKKQVKKANVVDNDKISKTSSKKTKTLTKKQA
ncbi:unnamed protein product [Rotaria magnacalcarata]|uniref:Uncharacterized protein n=1 Tax=Rotaria magnacalcarata TaxID=392030 RepID=A0A819YSY1_9BILA|nr:unnamed protein product [Rotaria magnacalcarata]